MFIFSYAHMWCEGVGNNDSCDDDFIIQIFNINLKFAWIFFSKIIIINSLTGLKFVKSK